MKHIKLVTAAAFVLGLGAIGSASAENGVINFVGTVTNATCQITGGSGTLDGTGNITVPLETATTAQLSQAGETANMKRFGLHIGPTDGGTCGSDSAVFGFDTQSLGNANSGNMINNETTAAATNVELQLLKDDGDTVIDLNTNSDETITLTAGQADFFFNVQYYATGAATQGGVDSFARYHAIYN